MSAIGGGGNANWTRNNCVDRASGAAFRTGTGDSRHGSGTPAAIATGNTESDAGSDIRVGRGPSRLRSYKDVEIRRPIGFHESCENA